MIRYTANYNVFAHNLHSDIVNRKMYYTGGTVVPCSYATPNYAIFAATLFWIGSKKTWVKLFSSFSPSYAIFFPSSLPYFSYFSPSYATTPYFLEENIV